jgi:hypothetical protein
MSKLTKSARGKDCALRLGCCNSDADTTVLAHLRSSSRGMGLKSPDWWGVYACSSCHDAIDGRAGSRVEFDSYDLLRALHETQRQMFDDGLLAIS